MLSCVLCILQTYERVRVCPTLALCALLIVVYVAPGGEGLSVCPGFRVSELSGDGWTCAVSAFAICPGRLHIVVE